MFKRRESSAEGPGSDSEVELIGVEDRVLENSSSNGNVYCIAKNGNKDDRPGTSEFCLSHVLDLDGYCTSG